MPFALNETDCLDKGMAYQELSLTVAKTLWYLDFERAPGEVGRLGEGNPGRTDGRDEVDDYQLYDIATADHKGSVLIFKPRFKDVFQGNVFSRTPTEDDIEVGLKGVII